MISGPFYRKRKLGRQLVSVLRLVMKKAGTFTCWNCGYIEPEFGHIPSSKYLWSCDDGRSICDDCVRFVVSDLSA